MKAVVAAVAVAVCLFISGCSSYHNSLVNAQGTRITCTTNAWGWYGVSVAASQQNECIRQYEAAGYQLQ